MRRKFEDDAFTGDHDENGKFAAGNKAAYKGSIEYVLAHTDEIISELESTGRVKATLRKFEITPGTFYRAVEKDDRLKEAIEIADKVRLWQMEDQIDDVIDNPADHKDITNPIANLTMIRLKKLNPEYRDNNKTDVTFNVLSAGELTQVADVYWKTRAQHPVPVIEAEHKVLPPPSEDEE